MENIDVTKSTAVVTGRRVFYKKKEKNKITDRQETRQRENRKGEEAGVLRSFAAKIDRIILS